MFQLGLDQITSDSWLKKSLRHINKNISTANVVGLIGALAAIFCLLAIPSSGYWNIRLPLYLIAVIWTITRPQIALYLLPFAISWGTADPANLGGLHLDDILVGLLAASWLMSIPLRQLMTRQEAENGALTLTGINVPRYLIFSLLGLLLVMLISSTAASSLFTSVKEIVKWLEVLVIVVLGSQYLRTRRQIWILLSMIFLAAISQACFGYAQYFLDLGPASFVRDASLRVYGTFDQPNPYAGYINMALTPAIALLLLGKSLRLRFLAGITAIVLAGVVFLSQSKGGWLALAVSFLFIVTVGFPRLRILLSAGAIILLCSIEGYLAGIIPERLFIPILDKIGLINISFTNPTTDNYANSERLAHWVAGINMFLDHPLVGVGIGNYSDAYPRYAPGIFVIPLGHAHNYYINIAAEAGVLGLIAFLLFILAVFLAGSHALRAISKKYKQLPPQATTTTPEALRTFASIRTLTNDRALAIGLMASLLAVCVHNIVDNLYVHGMAVLFALLLIMLIRLEGVVTSK